MSQFFSDLGFRFQTVELEGVSLLMLLGWDGGAEPVSLALVSVVSGP
ncbi:hypothetical protein [Mycobacterium stomatepiae]|uniref:Uncharacterized protein n=1 Tax=Mycobacterium stomatepiae TaxID=470076 RepID=A0A7I7Q0Q7_9MYCO|nr:hypothetical protein [Mycobacterium stomatepiae]MCV7166271.1 hypothetical protein [Mycobacterium stomatepiae]BBY19935.1 hypothetical protein MSTO_01400 [Mycobacterium stomatepiae]